MNNKEHALDLIEDLISNYLFYDRKGDETLTVKEMDNLIKSKQLTAEMIADRFDTEIRKALSRNFGV